MASPGRMVVNIPHIDRQHLKTDPDMGLEVTIAVAKQMREKPLDDDSMYDVEVELSAAMVRIADSWCRGRGTKG